MEKQDHIKYWTQSSKHDLEVADSLFNTKHFDYCLYLSHLSLEKTLKAFWVKSNAENNPPKTHNLVYLAQHSNLNLSDEQLTFLQIVNTFDIGMRYPDFKFDTYKKCTEDFTKVQFTKIKVFQEWLMKKL